MSDKPAIKLSELSTKIKIALQANFSQPIWIIAEINDLRLNQSGHCYLELVEKSDKTDQITATAKAVIWSFNYRLLKPYFETTTGIQLEKGLQVMVSVNVEFHELYGFSLNIKDIEPSFTVGELALKKQEIIKRLEKEGVLNMNRDLELPDVIQKIAVISSDSAAGYGDFMDQLINNDRHIRFYVQLFKASMQGIKAEESMINAFENIYKHSELFDVVVIIRGGGAKTDLACFDSYWLAYHIAQFPLPVITGIGHERDDSISDLVANTRLKTPTAVASFILQKAEEYELSIYQCQERIELFTSETFKEQRHQLELEMRRLAPLSGQYTNNAFNLLKMKQIQLKNASVLFTRKNKDILARSGIQLQALAKSPLLKEKQYIESTKKNISVSIKKALTQQHIFLDNTEKIAQVQNPLNILKKGFSYVLKDGKTIKSITQLKQGDNITNRFADGDVDSIVD